MTSATAPLGTIPKSRRRRRPRPQAGSRQRGSEVLVCG